MAKTSWAFLAGILCVSATTWVWAVDAPSDANDPTKERYCDPGVNADVLAQLKALEDQLNALDQSQLSQRMGITTKISQLSRKLQCTYRPRQDSN